MHPAERFQAPRSITRGVPLKDLLGPPAIELVGESFAAVWPAFDLARFRATAKRGLAPLGILPRGDHLAAALQEQVPPERTAEVLIASLGPELTGTVGFGLKPFFYLPHVALISRALVDDPAAGLRACYEVTKRFSAEFCIRPFLLRHPETTLAALHQWTEDANPHVRRLVSEGSRPRLPWACRLPPFQQDPTPTIALLQRLKDDPDMYVRRSVANHVGDIAKDHPDLALNLLTTWLGESEDLPEAQAEARRWIIRHAIRLPAQKGAAAAVRLRKRAGGR
jgi:3-methyladenine DNA glycosylase AlkC